MRTDEVVIPASLPSPAPDSPLEALSWLGDTVEEVAEGLRARGIKGRPNNPFTCPIHNYLAKFGWKISVCGAMFRVTDPDYGRHPFTASPAVIESFVRKFDAGGFPDLIDNG